MTKTTFDSISPDLLDNVSGGSLDTRGPSFPRPPTMPPPTFPRPGDGTIPLGPFTPSKPSPWV